LEARRWGESRETLRGTTGETWTRRAEARWRTARHAGWWRHHTRRHSRRHEATSSPRSTRRSSERHRTTSHHGWLRRTSQRNSTTSGCTTSRSSKDPRSLLFRVRRRRPFNTYTDDNLPSQDNQPQRSLDLFRPISSFLFFSPRLPLLLPNLPELVRFRHDKVHMLVVCQHLTDQNTRIFQGDPQTVVDEGHHLGLLAHGRHLEI